jgi:hypothetical protein
MIFRKSEEERPILVPASSFYYDDEAYTVEFGLSEVYKEQNELEVGGSNIA